MPRRKSMGLDQQIEALAVEFAARIAGVVRDAVAVEISDELGRVIAGMGDAHTSRFGGVDRRLGKRPVAVTCPAPGCDRLGIRAKRNFCAEHAGALSESDKTKYRQAQLEAKAHARVKTAGKRKKTKA